MYILSANGIWKWWKVRVRLTDSNGIGEQTPIVELPVVHPELKGKLTHAMVLETWNPELFLLCYQGLMALLHKLILIKRFHAHSAVSVPTFLDGKFPSPAFSIEWTFCPESYGSFVSLPSIPTAHMPIAVELPYVLAVCEDMAEIRCVTNGTLVQRLHLHPPLKLLTEKHGVRFLVCSSLRCGNSRYVCTCLRYLSAPAKRAIPPSTT